MAKDLMGAQVMRKEGRHKLTGASLYVDDVCYEGMLYGATIRSAKARGEIADIVFKPGVPWEEFTVVTAKDIPGENYVALIENDQPFLADAFVNHVEEPVVLIAHADRQLLAKARKLVEIEIKDAPAVFSIEESLEEKNIIWGKDNTLKEITIAKGKLDQGFAKAHHTISGEYRTGAQEQLYIEPNGMIARFEKGRLIVEGSMQCPYYIEKGLLTLLAIAKEKLSVVQWETGGGFGGKEEYPTMIAGHAALLALKSQRPVKIIYDRMEDMAATTKRHPSRTRIKSGWDKQGRLLALDIDFVLDGGAYATLSAVVLSRGAIHAAGPYFCANTRVKARAVATNTPPHGAFRGFGAPQSVFALEKHLDQVASKLALDPVELRKINFIKDGQATATGQVIKDGVDLHALMQKALLASNYLQQKKLFAQENVGKPVKKGIGIASFFHGAGFTGAGEKNLESVVGLRLYNEGTVEVLASSTEIGQGTNTIFAQIIANTLPISMERVIIARPDTSRVPNSGPTVASRTAMVVGKLLEDCGKKLMKSLQDKYPKFDIKDEESFGRSCATFLREPLTIYHQYIQPPEISWDDTTYIGDAYATYAWGVYVAEVSVDTRTFEVFVDNFWACQDVGQVLNPTLAAGQIEGGVAQGIGYGLYEECVYDEGSLKNNNMTNYIMPTSCDLGQIHVLFEETPSSYGPGKGVKGIGELPLDGSAPCVINAVSDALAVSLSEIPLTPERLYAACSEMNS